MSCDIGLAPLPDNPFTRGKCGFKIHQYHAASLPVVASPVGVNADYVRDGVTGFHAANRDRWVEAIESLIADPSRCRAMGAQGRKDAESFGLRAVSPRFCQIVMECLRAG